MTREQHLLQQLERRVNHWIYKNTRHEHTFSFDPAIVIPEHETYDAPTGFFTRPAHITHVRVSGVTMCACVLEDVLSCSSGHNAPRMFAISRLSTRMQIKILREIIPQLEKHTHV